jgi:hypothetical protein
MLRLLYLQNYFVSDLFFFKVIFSMFPYGFVLSGGHFKGTQKISSPISNRIYLYHFCPSMMDVSCSQSSGKMPFLNLCKKFATCRTNVPLNVCIISPLSLLGAFAKLRKTSISFIICLSVCPSVRLLSLCLHGTTRLPPDRFSLRFYI